ncbi:hypothetical protein SAMN05428969_1902 [Devosia sp. YR412]|uniref:hypothetical protein n=1 Tax=Devosia sp. YR412 TaxID=1881030 RepID=UPI0008CE031B|nr:hypothetical protein [Devosia sp. YR412]SEQ08789.1 hypothetical protein SAMN05428969_1902 [Devosia sp. YR412]
MARTVKLTTIDLWSQINGGQQLNAEDQAARHSGTLQIGKQYSPPESLVLGQSHRDEVFAFCGIKPKKLIWHQRSSDHFPDAENWPYAQFEQLYLYFDAEARWQGLNWHPDVASALISWGALGEHEPAEEDDVVAGRLRLLLNGVGMRGYVAMPNFIGMLSERGLRFTLQAMGYDKWLRFEAPGKTGTIEATFNLQVFKAKYESRFEIDYFLTSVTILSHDFWTAVSGAEARHE